MARGFESKSVEQQQAEMLDRRPRNGPPPTLAEQDKNRKRQGLLLSRTNLERQLGAAANPRHRQMLTEGIAELDRQLALLQ
ncbi:MAG: hypothetical protein HY010_15145 [Acidobacteria bacterium]|nr:hypothetical protein [Acidobacteriota bacterium]